MLALEIVGLLGILYIFFTVGTVRVVLARKAAHRKTEVQAKPAAA